MVILFINTDPTLIDVNIHPTKQDIKISKLEELADLITVSIDKALKSSLLIPKVEVKTKDFDNEIKIPEEYLLNDFKELIKEEQTLFNFSNIKKEENNYTENNEEINCSHLFIGYDYIYNSFIKC